ncbi:AraC family transcriptional regulator [Rhodocytophaga rosea]|uniref:AraC family transcriptional regulator n=1 Tax=Rhodocytophaga rosea TaxID=2704465 RepID=A0A6C0GKY7_9BACT|nr:AraC family transcriptional regulator [Rhodocytophaga rosea]QHT68607.1 AraC family transcriptional regulator [Rhodocytophaga rosea]
MKVQNSILRTIIYGAVKHGAPFGPLCQRIGVDPTELNDAEKLLDWEVSSVAWDYAVEMSGDPLLALHMGEENNLSAFGMLGYLVQSCSTLEEAFEFIVRYNNTLTDVFHFSTQKGRQEYIFHFNPVPQYRNKFPESSRQAVELMMSSLIRVFYFLTGKKVSPLRAHLAYPKRNVPEYERILQTKVIFDAESNCVVCRAEDMSLPIISYDKSLYSFFNLLLTEKQQTLSLQKSFSDQIKDVLLSGFGGQIPPIEVVAARMNMSLRTFQRRLAEEKITFRQITNDLRKELALSLMDKRHSKKADVAQLLGYADLSSFQRAYKNWTRKAS